MSDTDRMAILVLGLLLAGPVRLSASDSTPSMGPRPAPPGTEVYWYVAVPSGRTQNFENVRMEFASDDGTLHVTTRTESPDSLEVTSIDMEPDGSFLSAVRVTGVLDGGDVRTNSIQRDGQVVRVVETSSGRESTKQWDLPEHAPLAVDASLLILMRHFPFEQGGTNKVFVVDFSRRTTFIFLCAAGEEQVTVPAGTFACYRMEVTVDVPLIRPRITYWISKKEPHFLVKHSGKRGPLSRSYTTSLVRIGDPGLSGQDPGVRRLE